MAEPERRVLPGRPVLPARRRDVLESCRAPRLRDAWQKAAYRMAPQVSEVLRVELMQRVAPLQSVLAIQQARADESELLQGQSLRVRQASRLAAPLQVQEPATWVLLEQRPRALPVRLVLPLA
jgi:2-succinyl-5-enolpyruvyl-6-hydroxy-3-cyclohexene-1-carboxylate synthase